VYEIFRVKNIIYFDALGPQNTDKVVDAVIERLAEGDIKFVIVASITGETSLKIALDV